MKNRFKVVIMFLGIIALSGISLFSTSAIADGVSAPDFTLKDLDGKVVRLSDYEGKVVLLNFWATWCPPCRQEIPHFISMYDDLKDDGFVVLGISVDRKSNGEVAKWTEDHKVNYPVMMFTDKIYGTYQNFLQPKERGGIPFTFIIDREGIIRSAAVGYRPENVWRGLIEPLLGKDSE